MGSRIARDRPRLQENGAKCARTGCFCPGQAYVPRPLALSPPPPRSALPLVAAGIIALGSMPLLFGPLAEPLHWATGAGVVGLGALLALRRRVGRAEAPLSPLMPGEGRRAALSLLVVGGTIFLMIAFFVAERFLLLGAATTPLALALPLLSLLWLGLLGLRAWRATPKLPTISKPGANSP